MRLGVSLTVFTIIAEVMNTSVLKFLMWAGSGQRKKRLLVNVGNDPDHILRSGYKKKNSEFSETPPG